MSKKNIFTMMMAALIMIFCTVLPVSAASGTKTDDYTYIWRDSKTGYWYVQLYTYSSSDRGYSVNDYVVLKGSTLTDRSGTIISDDVESFWDEDEPTVDYYNKNLYFIFNNGDVAKMSKGTASSYAISKANANDFELDQDGIIKKVNVNSGSSRSISALSFSGSYKRNTHSSGGTSYSSSYSYTRNNSSDRIDTTMDSSNRVLYTAYKNGKSILEVACKDSNVYCKTYNKLITDTAVGAKFVGFTEDYDIVLYEQNGKLYIYEDGDKTFSRGQKVSLNQEIMYFEKDDDGFITSVVTSSNRYSISSVLDKAR